jgi:hypothetical protein
MLARHLTTRTVSDDSCSSWRRGEQAAGGRRESARRGYFCCPSNSTSCFHLDPDRR